MTTEAGSLNGLLADEITDVREFAERALGVLRQIRSPETWAQVYERGLEAAFAQHDMDGLAAVASLALMRFDALGQFDQLLSHIDFALAMAHGLPDAVVLLQSFRAPALAVEGDVPRAQDALRIAKRLLPRVTSARSRGEYVASSAVVSCLALDVDRIPSVWQAIGVAEQAGEHGRAAYTMSWLIPLMFAAGRIEEAEPWNQALRMHAQTIPHPYREADAETFAYARLVAESPGATDVPLGAALAGGNWLAGFRLYALQLHAALLVGDWPVAEQMVTALERGSTRMTRGCAESLPYFRALLSAYQSGIDLPIVSDPPRPSLITLSGLLAAGEAVAIAGTQHDAQKWLGTLERAIPHGVRTSVEWPVSRERVVALLLVRAGSVREAVRAFREAATWAADAGYAAEEALAQVQLAEVMSLAEIPSSERARTRLRRAGWLKLQEMGIDPKPHAYAATRALALRDDVSVRPQLTPRQVEVLALLAEGLTYREAAARLGTSWRTVSTQAYQAYERLGVSGKWEAVRTARRLQIL